MKKATVRTVETPHGEGRLHTRRATSPPSRVGGGVATLRPATCQGCSKSITLTPC